MAVERVVWGDCVDEIGGGGKSGTRGGLGRRPNRSQAPRCQSSRQGGPGTTSRRCGHSNAVDLRYLFCLQLSISVQILRQHRPDPSCPRVPVRWVMSLVIEHVAPYLHSVGPALVTVLCLVLSPLDRRGC